MVKCIVKKYNECRDYGSCEPYDTLGEFNYPTTPSKDDYLKVEDKSYQVISREFNSDGSVILYV